MKVMKPDKLFCYMFLLAFLTLTMHRPQQVLKCVGAIALFTVNSAHLHYNEI